MYEGKSVLPKHQLPTEIRNDLEKLWIFLAWRMVFLQTYKRIKHDNKKYPCILGTKLTILFSFFSIITSLQQWNASFSLKPLKNYCFLVITREKGSFWVWVKEGKFRKSSNEIPPKQGELVAFCVSMPKPNFFLLSLSFNLIFKVSFLVFILWKHKTWSP